MVHYEDRAVVLRHGGDGAAEKGVALVAIYARDGGGDVGGKLPDADVAVRTALSAVNPGLSTLNPQLSTPRMRRGGLGVCHLDGADQVVGHHCGEERGASPVCRR